MNPWRPRGCIRIHTITGNHGPVVFRSTRVSGSLMCTRELHSDIDGRRHFDEHDRGWLQLDEGSSCAECACYLFRPGSLKSGRSPCPYSVSHFCLCHATRSSAFESLKMSIRHTDRLRDRQKLFGCTAPDYRLQQSKDKSQGRSCG